MCAAGEACGKPAEFYCADGELNVTYTQPKDQASRRAIKYTHFNRNLITMSMLTLKLVENVSFIACTQNVGVNYVNERN